MENIGRAEDPFLEGYTSLGFLAGQTTTIELTLLVTGVTYRYPGVLAKAVTTLDVLSQGRSMLGLGAAWYDREHVALGIPYPPLSTRFEMLEETLQICRQMWSDDDGPYNGKHYQLAETLCVPQPIRRPPILIGGDGEKKTLRLVAQYADIWNSMTTDVDELKHKVDVLNRHCDTVGRDPGEIRKTCGGLLARRPLRGHRRVPEDRRTLRRARHRDDQRRPPPRQPRPRRLHPPVRRSTHAQARSDRLKRRNRLRFNNYHHGGRARTRSSACACVRH